MVTTAMIRAVAKLLLAPALVAAFAILVKGYVGPGDGFSAGVVAALGILLQYLVLGYQDAQRLLPTRLAPAVTFAGLLLALLIGFVPVLRGKAILTEFPPPGEEAIRLGTLELIGAFAYDVGVFVLVFGFTIGAISAIARAASRRD
jgi:multisubunit Na+/H+ antiporter MnhB subunit